VSVAASAEGSDLPAKASLVRAELPIAGLRGGQGPTWDGEPAEVEEFIRRTLA
jgi:hypothetical protein